MRVDPRRVDLSRVRTEFVEVREKRADLAAPPFVQDRKLWDRAVSIFRDARRKGQLPGEPYIVLTNVYRSIGGEFR